MAKKSILARQKKRQYLVDQYKEKRVQLKREGNYLALDKLPKNASPVRLVKRCWSCGRKRYFIGRFGTCRICFRHKASTQQIHGITKAS